MKLYINLLLLTILILVSCNKLELKEVNSAYQGEWHSLPVVTVLGNTVDTYIIIDGDQGEYGEWCELNIDNCSNRFWVR